MTRDSEGQRVLDNATLQFARFAQRGDWHGMGLRHAEEMMRRAVQAAGPPPALEGEPAAQYVEQLIDRFASSIQAQQNAYGPLRWLWYLRRLPEGLFQGHRSTTAPYDRRLAEALSWYSTGSDVSQHATLIAFKADESAFRQACRYVAATKMLAHIHSMYRRIGKGASLAMTRPIPGWRQSNAVESAIETYDERHARAGSFHQQGLGLGTLPADAPALGDRIKQGLWDLLTITYCDPEWVPVRGPDASGNIADLTVIARHGLGNIPIEAMLWPYGKERELNLPWLQAIEPLVVLLMMLPLFLYRIPWALSSTLQMGYFVARATVLESLFDTWIPVLHEYLHARLPAVAWSSTFVEWKKRIDAIPPILWPLQSGGVLRRLDQSILIDVTAASNALVQRTQVDRTASGLANARAQSFELQVQRLVDASPWNPGPVLGQLRGLPLRRGGRSLTDIDAIGSRGDVLLLISCKSVVYDAGYDKGEYRVVRNAQSTVDDAVNGWGTFIQALYQDARGDNFDFSQFRQFIGVVCTPFVVYSSEADTLAHVAPGLPRCASTAELYAWLQS